MDTEPRLTMHWADRGACGDSDPDLFFPFVRDGGPAPHTAVARRICANCPVRLPCLTWAVETGEPDGIWGGTTPDERRHMRSVRLRHSCDVEDHADRQIVSRPYQHHRERN